MDMLLSANMPAESTAKVDLKGCSQKKNLLLIQATVNDYQMLKKSRPVQQSLLQSPCVMACNIVSSL